MAVPPRPPLLHAPVEYEPVGCTYLGASLRPPIDLNPKRGDNVEHAMVSTRPTVDAKPNIAWVRYFRNYILHQQLNFENICTLLTMNTYALRMYRTTLKDNGVFL